MDYELAERVYHPTGPAVTIGGGEGLRIDVNVSPDDLPGRVWVRNGSGHPVLTGVLGADRNGWPVVADIAVTSAAKTAA